jgi:hypothetical protein
MPFIFPYGAGNFIDSRKSIRVIQQPLPRPGDQTAYFSVF